MFTVHSLNSAPSGSVPRLQAAQEAFGFLPNLLAVLAESPLALETYLTVGAIFQRGTLSRIEQNVVLLTVSVANRCHYCVAAHSMIAETGGVTPTAVARIREGLELEDVRLEALRRFTDTLVKTRGWATEAMGDFLAAGFTKAQVLEVLVGISQKTLSNYINHLAHTPLDTPFKATAWAAPE